jgi:hypothetical protein
MVNETDIVELELKGKRFNLSVKKKEALAAEAPVQVGRRRVGVRACVVRASACARLAAGL